MLSLNFKKIQMSLAGILVFTLVTAPPASATYFYRVKRGETLSQILHDLNLKPIYGKSGMIDQTLSRNHKLASQNEIFPSQTIDLPVETGWVPPKGFEIRSNEEVIRVDRVIAQESPAAVNAEEVKPAAEPVSAENPENPKSGLRLGLGLRYFKLDAVDTVTQGTSHLYSKLSPDFSAAWEMRWTDSTLIRLEGGVSLYSFEELNSNQSYVNGSGSLPHFSVGVDHRLSSRFTVGAAIHFQSEMFLVAQSATVLKVDQVTVAQPAVSARYDLFQKGNGTIGILGEGRLLLSSDVGSYQVKSGSAFKGGLFIRHDRNATSGLQGEVTYGITNQDSSIMTKSLNEIGLTLQYRWGIY